jgi:hypothetical protein
MFGKVLDVGDTDTFLDGLDEALAGGQEVGNELEGVAILLEVGRVAELFDDGGGCLLTLMFRNLSDQITKAVLMVVVPSREVVDLHKEAAEAERKGVRVVGLQK